MAYTVEHFGGPPGAKPEVIARVTELSVANAVFEAAAREHPTGVLLLKHGATVLRTSRD